ncbi:MAG: UDP-glucose 4-epimerase GalE [Brevinemataceae bacterium]
MDQILVVGGAGYIGSHTVKSLYNKGYKVIVLDNLSKGYRQSLDQISTEIEFIEGDLGNEALLADIFKKYNISAVMHFAAYIEVGASVSNPALYYENNLVKIFTLLEAMRKANINNFVFSSTAAVFGNPHTLLIDETHSKLPINPYGNTKLMVEIMLKDYAHAYHDFQYTIFRYFNACGADPEGKLGQSYFPATHVISIAMETAAGQREQIGIFGTDYPTPDGTCIRDYIHVTDLAEAHIMGMERMIREKVSDDFNLGTGRGFSVREIISKSKAITGVDFTVVESDRRPGDPPQLVANPSKANNVLAWKAKYGLDEIIKTAWYWANNKPY